MAVLKARDEHGNWVPVDTVDGDGLPIATETTDGFMSKKHVQTLNAVSNKYIVESGKTDGWYWEKWSDGTTKAKTTTGLQKGIVCSTAYGGLFHSDTMTITVPASLISTVTDIIPRIIVTNGIVHIVVQGVANNVISYYVVNGLASTGINTNIMFEVEGVSAN